MPFTFFSPLMGFAMRPNDPAQPARYHRGNMDMNWQSELSLSWQMDGNYEQKIETGDPFRFQVKSTPNTSRTLQIINCHGKVLATLPFTATYDYTGDKAADGAQYTTYQYSYANWKNLVGVGDIFRGRYWLKYTVVYDASTTDVFISEPLNVKGYQPDTVLMEYTNPRYLMGSPFDAPGMAVIYRFRVEGYIEQFQPRSQSTVYNDQKRDVKVLDYSPYRVWRFYVGEPTGVADWVFDKLNHIWACARVMIDGKQYTASTASPSWGMDGKGNSPSGTGNMEIQDALADEGFTSPVRKIKLWTSPAVYPYVIGTVNIATLFTIYGAKRFASLTDETNFLPTLNANLQNTELLGTITRVGNDFWYNLVPGETYTTAFVPLYTLRMFWNYLDPGPAVTGSVDLGNFEGAIAWGDGVIDHYTIGATPQTVQHNYAGVGIYTIECWHSSCGYFKLAQSFCEAFAGAGPTNSQQFIINNHKFTSNTFFWGLLQNSRNTLQLIDVSNNALTNVNNFTNWVWPKLKTLYYMNNKFSSSGASGGIVECNTNATNASPDILRGTYDITGQTPAAVIDGSGISAAALLRQKQWIVRY